MEQHRPNHEEFERHEAKQRLGEMLRELEFEEPPLLSEIHDVLTESCNEGDYTTALIAYARYQEVGQGFVDTWGDQNRGRLALNIALINLLVERNELDRYNESVEDCIMDADGLGYPDIADQLARLPTQW